jgi:transposase-like protein
MVILVAPGFWEDGRREVLDWQIAKSEDQNAWEVLVQRLWERGCRPEQGLQLVVRDGSRWVRRGPGSGLWLNAS